VIRYINWIKYKEKRVEEKKSEERKVLIKVNGLKTYYPVKKGIFRNLSFNY